MAQLIKMVMLISSSLLWLASSSHVWVLVCKGILESAREEGGLGGAIKMKPRQPVWSRFDFTISDTQLWSRGREPNLAKSSWSKVAGTHVIGPEQLVARQRQWEWQDDRVASSAPMLSNTETWANRFQAGEGRLHLLPVVNIKKKRLGWGIKFIYAL